jgi:hypothetical protein
VPQLCDLLRGQGLFSSEPHASRFGFLDAIHLSFGTYLRLELRNGSKHIEQQVSGRIPRVDVLIEHLKVDLFTCEFLRDLTQMQGGSCQPIQARHHERIAFPNIFQARL